MTLDAYEHNVLYLTRKWADWMMAGNAEAADVYLVKWKETAKAYLEQYRKEGAS